MFENNSKWLLLQGKSIETIFEVKPHPWTGIKWLKSFLALPSFKTTVEYNFNFLKKLWSVETVVHKCFIE